MEFLEKATTSKKHICEKCGSTDTQKLFSGFSVGQSGGNDNSCPTCPGGTCGLNY